MIKNVPALTIIFLLITTIAGATEQAPDLLFYKGKKWQILPSPLETYYKNKPEPNFMTEPHRVSSGNWRGYVASWEITDDILYLVGIDSYICTNEQGDCRRAKLSELFGEKVIDGKVKADWFTGDLTMPDGKLIKMKNALGSVYERSMVLKIDSGKLISSREIDNRKPY